MTIPKKNLLEWTVFGVGLILLLATVGYLAADMLADDGKPPQIAVQIGEPTADDENFRVPVRVTNNGDNAAEQVEIEISIEGAAEPPASLMIDLLPSKSSEDGAVYFQSDPSAGQLKGRVVGHLVP